ncbi:uncharacterized protein LOC128196765 [Vigna angularis]|uniref:uncharacterized protein LOC128194724 n=1 Tax=Phaseolus angularis TaxID=3914 RepID=UPI0022B4AF9A|nr:uncharacterized protein LOC128194724 [Vigna angularis]XP_052734286.1 uncharacterized protein LOC128196765 [Vigna angularis]
MATPSVTLASLQDTTHDYYIHPNENPSLVLVSPILEGHNYHGWARSMSMALQMKNKFGFVDGSIPCPAGTDPMVQAWKRCNNLVLSWINHSVSHEIATSIIWIDSAATAWKDLKDRFSQEVNPLLPMIMAGEDLHIKVLRLVIKVLRLVPQGEGLVHLDNALTVAGQTTPLILAF